jgi:hypothetical protein
MSAQMTLLFVEHTGHVLAALRQLDDATPTVTSLVGESFPWRVPQKVPSSPAAVFDVPEAELEATSVLFDEAVIGRPQDFVVAGDRTARPGNLTPPTVELTHTALKLTLSGGPGADTKVFAAVCQRGVSDPQRRLLSATWPASESPFEINLTILPGENAASIGTGDYDVVVAIEGYPLIHEEQTV